jgi:hypothetical protein
VGKESKIKPSHLDNSNMGPFQKMSKKSSASSLLVTSSSPPRGEGLREVPCLKNHARHSLSCPSSAAEATRFRCGWCTKDSTSHDDAPEAATLAFLAAG